MKSRTTLLLSLIVAVCSCGVAAQRTAKICKNATLADIVFLIDGSTSIGSNNFKEIKYFIKNVTEALDIGPDKVQIGLAQYSLTTTQEFLLKEYKDKSSLQTAVENINYQKGGTYTGQAISFLKEKYFIEDAGSRINQQVPQIAVIITDGDSWDDVKVPAESLRKEGVRVFGIAVGLKKLEVLHSIANRPPEHFVLAIDNFNALPGLLDSLLQTVCTSMEDLREALAQKFADFFVLVDSGLNQRQFTKFRAELVEFINKHKIGESTHRIGLAQYAQDTNTAFLLNAFQTQQETLAGVRRFRLKPQPNQSHNLGAAIKHAISNFFSREAGGRAHLGYDQHLVTVTARDSDDSVRWVIKWSKSQGFDSIGAMAPPGASPGLKDRFKDMGFSFATETLNPFEIALSIEKQENVTEDCTGANVADIVFIVDESDSIGTTNFRLVRSFLHSMVASLDVKNGRVRIGIVTYNDRPMARVYLNSFDDKDEILQFVKILPYRGGGRNTGAALNFTLKEIFNNQRGQRKGVQQVAVVITDGESEDNVRDEAHALRRAGVTIYAVGVQNASMDELKEMVSHPPNRHIFHKDDFTGLKVLKQSLQKTMCNNIIQESIIESTEKTDIKEACSQKEQADIFFLMDDSGSIENNDFLDMLKFINKLICNFRIGPQHVRIGLVKFASSPTLQFDLTAYSDTKSLENAVNRINHDGGGTKTGEALSSMESHFREAAKSRPQDVPRYLIVLTDGKSEINDPNEIKDSADKLRAQGVTILAIGVKDAVESELLEIAGGPQRTFYVTNFDGLNSIVTTIPIDICAPDVCREVQSDIFFLADSSRTIHPRDYQKMKDFLKSIINESSIEQNGMHFGLMQYSSVPELIFSLDRFYSKDEMVLAIDNMQQMVQYDTTETGKAITQVSEYFDADKGGRPNLRQKLIVITDGDSHDDVNPPAAALRAKEVVIYAVGVGQADTSELKDISGSVDRVITERNFDTLKNLEKSITLKLCDPMRECKKIERADIIFLVDGSGSISSTQFESMQKFMVSVVNQTAVGDDLTRFGFILFSEEPESKFELNTYRNKSDILTAIQRVVPPQKNTYTSKALKYSLQFFSAGNGGRKANKVPQILMVITDGEATDPHDLKGTSDALRDNGITVFSIGVKEAKRAELETMAGGDTSKVFFVDNFKALETLYKNISSELCGSTKRACPKEQADLVFLLDQSDSISPTDYSIMINFTAELVNGFSVSKKNVHVGLAQFSTENKHEFYLNKYDSSSDVIAHIKSLNHSGGGTLIGKALNYIKDYFKPSQGSRAGISKNLVLITDGDSQDNVKPAADLLKNLGIEVFTIGIGNVHDVELLQIAGVRERLFRAENFNGLDQIKSKVVDTICDSKPPRPDCSIDIAMGFDISRTRARIDPLISGQIKLQTFLPEIVRYVSSVDGLCCFDYRPILTNIGFRVVSRDGRTLDDFNFEGYSADVVNKVMTLNLAEPTYFNSALLRSFGEKFKTKSQASVKVLVIFSDGLDEDMTNLQMESEKLRESGVSALLIVALEGVRNPAQLQKLEFGRGYDYNLPLSIGMPSVGSNIVKQIDKAGNRVCCGVMCTCQGPEGPPGLHGRRGPKGSVGPRAQPGFPGDEGDAGDRGPPGPDGPPGFTGCPGTRGVKGGRGISGNKGDLGEDGLDGVDGEQGLVGSNGAPGTGGHAGKPGIPGIRGPKGQKGERGLRGDPGEPGLQNNIPGAKGDPGYNGLNGEPGPDGQPGEPGEDGNKGQDGRRGPTGEKGRPGQGGGRGVPGSPGASGPQGRPGPNGERGPKGNPGFPGLQGEPGPVGDPGLPGRRGANGQKGQPGDPGVKGAPGSPGHIGAPGQDGRDGYGSPGPKGVKGDPGFPGFPGLPGDYGQQGTKGYPGKKGNQGRGGISGDAGLPGTKGEPGLRGHRGSIGPPGDRENVCKLIQIIRDNCGCSFGEPKCPAYPTELVFALDMSEDVTPAAFERQRSALLFLLKDIAISESNCPTGARVAVVGYSTYTKYLIRFQDYRRHEQLIESVKNIALERTSNRRQLGAAMRFVGQNVFKRVRSGLMMRKVAIFFSNGISQDSPSIVTSVMEFRALNIVPAVVSLRPAPAVSRALQVDDSGNSMFTVLGSDRDAALSRVKNCTICYDPCTRPEECTFIQDAPQPQEVNMDLVMVVDSSREMQADEYAGAQELLGSVVEQLAVSRQPRRAGNQARVAVVQQSATRTINAEFSLQTYQSGDAMRRHLIQTMRQQSGSSALGQTLEFALSQVLLKASQPRRRKVILTVVGTQTAYEDRAKLRFISQKAKCEGVALFVVTVGERYSRKEVEELASTPLQQHLIHVNRLKADEQGYTQRFFRVFLSALSKGMNTYPPPSMRQTCETDGSADVQEDMFADEQRETFEEQTGGEIWTEQLDAIDTLTREDKQSPSSGPDVVPKPQLVSFISKDACFLSPDTGRCHNYTIKWFFNSDRGKCLPFWYGGCDGNDNRFETQKDCETECEMKSR